MSLQASFNHGPNHNTHGHPMASTNTQTGDGVSVRPMRLKVLYTFDDQNKTNCLARGQDVLQVQTVALDETTTIGVLDLKTCIEAVIQCSPELVNRLGQDYTVYAYDYSEYDNPLVGQGMLSKALATASPGSNAPALQSTKLITGRVCKNILGIFNNGVPETLEVKLRLVPVPIAIQTDYVNTMERYNRDMNNSPIAPGFDHNEWTKFLQSNPNMSQMTPRYGTPGSTCSNPRGSMNMEVVNQLLSPAIAQQTQQVPQSQEPQTLPALQPRGNPFSASNGESGGIDSGHDTDGGKSTKGKKTRGPAKNAVKRPRAKRQPKEPKAAKSIGNNASGNTSGYEEGTDGDDGDDGPAPRKRAKVTQTDWNSRSAFGQPTDSLRKAASTAGSLRLFRPIAVASGNNPLEEIPRPPTPLPKLAARQEPRSQSHMRRASLISMSDQGGQHLSPYPGLTTQDLRLSIESANTSPERQSTPGVTPPEMASSPPIIRSESPLHMRSSPPCPSSPVLPQMPRTDSGFMSGSLEEQSWEEDLFGPMDGNLQFQATDFDVDLPQLPPQDQNEGDDGFYFAEEVPGRMDMLPSTMRLVPPKSKVPPRIPVKPVSQSRKAMAKRTSPAPANTSSQSISQLSQSAVPRQGSAPPALSTTYPTASTSLTPEDALNPMVESGGNANTAAPPNLLAPAPQQRQGSRLARTNSMGAIPTTAFTHPAPQRSSLHRAQTWSDLPSHDLGSTQMVPPTMPEMNSGGVPVQFCPPPAPVPKPISAQAQAKKEKLQKRLETALEKGELPPFCNNCGTIKTATWRTSWSQDHVGIPGYYDFSDEPGHVSCVVILTRDAENNKPTSYKLIKRFLGKGESKENWKDYILCNPCGLWMNKYNFQRPEDKWECNKGKGRFRKRPSRAKDSNGNYLTSDANIPQSEGYFPQSDTYYSPLDTLQDVADARSHSETATMIEGGQILSAPSLVDSAKTMDGAADARSPIENSDIQVQRVELPAIDLPPTKMKNLNPMTSDFASDALRRAIRSSPARWKREYSTAETRDDSEAREVFTGARDSPIELDSTPDRTRRLLFPSPRKDGMPKVLGEASGNGSRISPRNRSSKVQDIDLPNKENCPPPIEDDDEDAELLRLFEEEIARPSTPLQGAPLVNQFKTPTQPNPSHRPITRSLSRSARSARILKSPSELLRFSERQTPNKTPSRRSPRNHAPIESPFTRSINQMMADAGNHLSPSQADYHNMDFSNLPDLPMGDMSYQNGTANQRFSLEDFFSTDMVMPSSPPRNFNLYEDPIDWTQFNNIGQINKQTIAEVVLKEEVGEVDGMEGVEIAEAVDAEDEVDLVRSSS